jgi:hypothetical protein
MHGMITSPQQQHRTFSLLIKLDLGRAAAENKVLKKWNKRI